MNPFVKKLTLTALAVAVVSIGAVAVMVLHPHKASAANICFTDGCLSSLPVCGTGSVDPTMTTQQAMEACIKVAWGVSPGECCRLISVMKDATATIITSAWIGCSNGWGTWVSAILGNCVANASDACTNAPASKSVTVTEPRLSCNQDSNVCTTVPGSVTRTANYDACGVIVCDGSCSATHSQPAGVGVSCTAVPNGCGQIGVGAIQCNSTCSAQMMPNPAGCTSTDHNDCAMYGQGYQCTAGCNAKAPMNSACPPPSIGTQSAFSGGGGGDGVFRSGGIGSTTVMVNQGSTATLKWNASPANTCTLTDDIGPAKNVSPDGSTTTPPVVARMTYVLSCWLESKKYGKGPVTSISIKVIPNPKFQEL